MESPYKRAQRLAELTKVIIVQDNITRLKRYFVLAEKIYVAGNTEIKNAVLNVFLFSVSSFIEINKPRAINLLPEILRQQYYKQVITFGI